MNEDRIDFLFERKMALRIPRFQGYDSLQGGCFRLCCSMQYNPPKLFAKGPFFAQPRLKFCKNHLFTSKI
jgi:hypothetical protein